MPSVLKAAVIGLAVACSGCDIIGPTCVARQQRGSVASLSGDVAAGEIAVHRVAYGVQGSQNDARIGWGDQFSTNGPRIQVFATRVECERFVPAGNNAPGCAVIARGGSSNGVTVSTLIVTHGRGNPEQLGNPPEYKLWVVGDPQRSVRYTIDISYFYGPDC